MSVNRRRTQKLNKNKFGDACNVVVHKKRNSNNKSNSANVRVYRMSDAIKIKYARINWERLQSSL